MTSPIPFGTDGWRARIGRDLTFDSTARVVDAVAAWSTSPANDDPGDGGTLPIVHDTRFLSRELAAESAARLATKGFRILLSDRPVPTPCASWHVKERGLRGGIAITASHNPPEWNGVKYKSWFGGSATAATYDAIAACADVPLPDRSGGAVEKTDLLSPYAAAIAACVDLDAIRRAGLEGPLGPDARRRGRPPRVDPRRGAPDAGDDDPGRDQPFLRRRPPRADPRAPRRHRGTPRVGELRPGPRQRRGRRPPRRPRSRRHVRDAPSHPRPARREPREPRTDRRRHRQDLLHVAPRRPRRGPARSPPPRHADRLQVDRREDALGRGRDRRRGIGRPGRLLLPPGAGRRPLRPPRPRGGGPLRASRSPRSWPARSASTGRSRTAGATCGCRCRS